MDNKLQNRVKSEGEMFCSDCGEVISSKAEICPKCGVRQKSSSTQAPNGKSKVAAGVLALIVGSIGVHKFYLGQIGWGIIYLLFCWTFIPAIVAFVEGILFLVMSDEEFVRKYGHR